MLSLLATSRSTIAFSERRRPPCSSLDAFSARRKRSIAATWSSAIRPSRGAEPIEIFGPRLHELAALFEPLGAIVDRTHAVRIGVRETELDQRGVVAALMHHRRE